MLPMTLLRKYLWVWVIIGMIFVSTVISLIFLLINECISRRGKHKFSKIQKETVFAVESNKYEERNFDVSIPPLPPRTQFLTAEAQSYENLAEVPDHEQNTVNNEEHVAEDEQSLHDYEEALPEYEEALPEYEEALPEYEEALPEYEEALPEYEEALPEYEEALPEYEEALPECNEALVEQDDYVKVENEEEFLPPPPSYKDSDPQADNISTEDYDDIGGEEKSLVEEDYDDIGGEDKSLVEEDYDDIG